tara:strand:- start:8131 stop:10077 length:1947 start_codon:yes stop_codon:yes gene_type:complete
MKRIFLGLTALPLFVQAQYELEEVIHKERIPVQENYETPLDHDASDILASEKIHQTKPTSVDDILRQSPVATTARGPRSSSESIQVRGLDANKLNLTIDGARQNFRSGHSTMTPVNFENLKAVQVFKSPADFSRGSSLGGGVNFVTKDPEDYLKANKKSGSEFKYQNSSANAENLYNAKTIVREKSYSALLSLTTQNASNTELNNGETLENSAYEDFMGFAKIKSGHWSFSHDYFRREDDNPLDPSLNPPDTIESLQADSELIRNSTIVAYEEKNWRASLYYTTSESIKTQRDNEVDEIRRIETTGLNFNQNIEQTSFGAEIYQDRLDSEQQGESLTSYPKAHGVNASAFAEHHFKKNQWTLTPGLKANYYQLESEDFDNKSASELSQKFKVSYHFDESTYLFASYAQGFNAPRVSEVYPSGLHSLGDGWIVRDNYFIPNTELKHETSANRELGFSSSKFVMDYRGQLYFNASIYENKIEDYIRIERIDRSVLDEENGTSQFINIPEVTLYGGEVELGFLYDIYEWKVAYSQVRGKNETENLYLEDLPADQYLYTFNIDLDKYQMRVGYLGIQALEQNRTNPETIQRTEKTPSYFIHNIYADKKLGNNFEVGMRVDNLGNKEYRRHGSFLNESREDISLSLKYKINTL